MIATVNNTSLGEVAIITDIDDPKTSEMIIPPRSKIMIDFKNKKSMEEAIRKVEKRNPQKTFIMRGTGSPL